MNQLAVLRNSAVSRVSEDHAWFGTAIAAGQINRRILGKLLKQGNQSQLRKSPGVRHAHEDTHAGPAELISHYIRLLFAVHQHR